MTKKQSSDSGRALGTGAAGDPDNPGTPFDAIPNTTPEDQQAVAEAAVPKPIVVVPDHDVTTKENS